MARKMETQTRAKAYVAVRSGTQQEREEATQNLYTGGAD